MPTLIATAGASTANSFATIAECDTYCDARLNASTWTDETDDDQKARALIGATAELSSRESMWDGRRSNSTQALAWPRFYAKNPDDPWGLYFDSAIVPQRVKNATMELALIFLAAGTTDLTLIDPKLEVISKTLGPLKTDYAPYLRAKGLNRFPSVMRFLTPMTTGSSYTVPLVRG